MAFTTVIDTNILLVSVSRKSRYHWIFEGLRNARYDLLLTTPIILEYEEIVSAHMGRRTATTVVELLENAPNVREQRVYYHWNLIRADPDDNKFVDCALAGGADFIVTNDRHFDVLQDVEFPDVAVISPDEFRKRLAERS